MKKILVSLASATALVLGGAALAGDVMTQTQIQNGNGTNGTTGAAPSGACGLATQSTAFSAGGAQQRCVATQALLGIQAASGKVFVTSAVQGYMRGYVSGLSNPDGGSALVCQPMPSLDVAIDAGTLGGQGGASNIVYSIPLPPLPKGTTVDWVVENALQTGASDAGVGVSITLLAPSSCQ